MKTADELPAHLFLNKEGWAEFRVTRRELADLLKKATRASCDWAWQAEATEVLARLRQEEEYDENS